MPLPVIYMPVPVIYMPVPVIYMPVPVIYIPMAVIYKPVPVIYMPVPVILHARADTLQACAVNLHARASNLHARAGNLHAFPVEETIPRGAYVDPDELRELRGKVGLRSLIPSKAVLGIRDFLARIRNRLRIRLLTPVTLRMQNNTVFFLYFFLIT
jgi:hypothetical protein